MKKHFLFDMDGTLLPMDLEAFGKYYFDALGRWVAGYGHDPKLVLDSMLRSVGAIYKSDGVHTNEELFWSSFTALTGLEQKASNDMFNAFYEADFVAAKASTHVSPDMIEAVRRIQRAGITPVLATNAIFPLPAIRARIGWAGLSVEDFCYVTMLENSHYLKPDPRYYTEILDMLGYDAHDTVMIGNDLSDDAGSKPAGLTFVLVTDWMLNADKPNVADYTVTSKELPALITKLLED